jgi:hypothetical protein
MNTGTAFLLGFGTCLLFWVSSVILGSKIEKSPTPEEEAGLDPKLTPVRFCIMRTARFLFPSLVSLWIDLRKARQNSSKRDH